MIVRNIADRKVESEKFKPETTIEKKTYEIKDDHMKNIDSLDMKTSTIKPNNIYSSS